ncbi:MAG: deoxyhypusine synthase family protein [Myxococcota bacterium]
MSKKMTGSTLHHREMRDGVVDGLKPLHTLDLDSVGDLDELLAGMSQTAFGGRNLGEAAEVLQEMIADPECTVVLTLSGAMTVAKMNLVIVEMLERGWVQGIVSTGALMTHGLVELAGMQHFKASKKMDDTELFEKGYNRVYDTYELEKNLNDLSDLLREVFVRMPTNRRWGSRELLHAIGEYLAPSGKRGIMSTCYRLGVPVYVPAFSDSELALDLAVAMLDQRLGADPDLEVEDALLNFGSSFDSFLDLGHFSRLVSDSPKMGIVTIGGGVPRNWAQQAPPFIDIVNTQLERSLPLTRYCYGVRICPEPAHWGGLSGCSYSEGVSWGKFLPVDEGGRYAEVFSDATIAWPILVKAVAQRMDKNGLEAQAPVLNLPGVGPR